MSSSSTAPSAVPLLRWRRLEGKAITANCSANNILQYNYAYQIGILYSKGLQKLHYEHRIILIKIFQSTHTKLLQ